MAGKSIVKEVVSSFRVRAVLTAELGGTHLYSQYSQGGGRMVSNTWPPSKTSL